MKKEVRETFHRPKIVSSAYGRIKRVMLVYWAFLDDLNPNEGPRKYDEERIRRRVIKFYRPLIEQMVRARKEDEDLHFDFLIESRFKLGSVEDRSPRSLGADLRKFAASELEYREDDDPVFPEFCPPSTIPETEELGNTRDDQLSYRPRRCYRQNDLRFSYRLVLMNVDFKTLAYEAIRALDLNSNVFDLNDTSNIFYWIQDPFIAMTSDERDILLEPFYAWPTIDGILPPFNFKNIPEVISSQTSMLLKSVPFYLQGGNILAGSNYAFIGAEVYRLNRAVYYEALFSEQETLANVDLEQIVFRAFTKDLALALNLKFVFVIGVEKAGKEKAICCPSAPKPLFHLDLFLTIGGRFVINQHVKRNCELILLGQIHTWKYSTKSNNYEWLPIDDPQNSSLFPYEPVDNELNQVIEYLNQVKAQLILCNFHIERVPILYWKKQYYHYNNCLVEISANPIICKTNSILYESIIYLPQFAWSAFDNLLDSSYGTHPNFADADDLVKRKLEGLGFEVRPVDMQLRSLASSKVGLHCMSAVLSRVKHPANPHPETYFEPSCRKENPSG